jgi:hypothetical protein
MNCSSCELLTINGVVCHETGCPDSHLFTTRDCLWCGQQFTPDSPSDYCCDGACYAMYHGIDVDQFSS